MNIITKSGHEFNYGIWYYLAGPMTGIRDYNFPAFEKAVIALEEAGIMVKSPHMIDHGQHEFSASFSAMCCGKLVTRIGADGREYGDECGKSPDDPIHSFLRGSLPYSTYLKAGYRMLLNCEGIILINGWTQSTGAKHELHVARSLGYPVYTLGEGFLMELGGDEN